MYSEKKRRDGPREGCVQVDQSRWKSIIAASSNEGHQTAERGYETLYVSDFFADNVDLEVARAFVKFDVNVRVQVTTNTRVRTRSRNGKRPAMATESQRLLSIHYHVHQSLHFSVFLRRGDVLGDNIGN